MHDVLSRSKVLCWHLVSRSVCRANMYSNARQFLIYSTSVLVINLFCVDAYCIQTSRKHHVEYLSFEKSSLALAPHAPISASGVNDVISCRLSVRCPSSDVMVAISTRDGRYRWCRRQKTPVRRHSEIPLTSPRWHGCMSKHSVSKFSLWKIKLFYEKWARVRFLLRDATQSAVMPR